MKYLDFADGVRLPVDVVTDTQAVLGIKGGGKTYAMMKLMESMVAGGHQAVAIDPTGVWWGLTSSADGKARGLDVVVMGGKHATVPLEATAGETIARFVVDSGQSVVLSLSHMHKADRQRFCAAFMEKLFDYKDEHREPLHLFMDEAQTLAPQRPGKDQLRVLGAAEDVVLLGRSRGLGMTMGTQRPAKLNKDLLTQVGAMILLRIASPQDQAAASDWLEIHATEDQTKQVMATLASLGRDPGTGERVPGDAWYLSTSGEGAARIRVKEKWTYDSSRTPKPGERTVTPKERTPVDLEKLSAEIRATVERAKASDPKVLAAEVTRLNGEIKKIADVAHKHGWNGVENSKILSMFLDEALGRAKAPAAKSIERFVLKDGQIERADKLISRLADAFTRAGEIQKGLKETTDGISLAIQKTQTAAAARVAPAAAAIHSPSKLTVTPISPKHVRITSNEGSDDVGQGGLRRILIALAQRPGMTNRQIGIRAGMATGGGSFRTYMSRARTKAWIRDEGDRRFITDEGVAALGSFEPLPTGTALLEYWLGELGDSGARRILEALAGVYPDAMTNDRIAWTTGMSADGGSFRTYMSRLRTLELVTSSKAGSKASEELFEGSSDR